MRLVAEYLDRAMQFERMAEHSQDPKLRDQLLQQAEAYRKLAAKRASQLGAPQAADPDGSDSGSG